MCFSFSLPQPVEAELNLMVQPLDEKLFQRLLNGLIDAVEIGEILYRIACCADQVLVQTAVRGTVVFPSESDQEV